MSCLGSQWLRLAAGAILLAACGTKSSDADDPTTGLQPNEAFVDAFCTNYLAAKCQAIADCYPSDDGFLSSARTTTPECEADREGCLAAVRPLSVGVVAGRLVYDAAAAQACFDSLGLPSCRLGRVDCFDAPFAGQVPPGDRCYESVECVGGGCVTDGCGAPGTCRAYVGIGENAPVPQLCDPAVGYSSSTSSSAEGTCVAFLADGERCYDSIECVEGSFCDQFSPAHDCHPFGAEGAPCTGINECSDGLGCQDNVSHAIGGGRCGPQRSLEAPCIAPGADECEPGLTCRGADSVSGVVGACGPYGARGETCGQSSECGFGLYCDTAGHTCGDRPGFGEACYPNAFPSPSCFGEGLTCVTLDGQNGTCGTYAALGESCLPYCPADMDCGASNFDPYLPCAAGLECTEGLCTEAMKAGCASGT